MMDYDIESTEKSVTGTFRALADARQRRLLAIVRERSPSRISVSEAAARLADDAATSESMTEDDRREVTTSLYHVHVPLLVEEGLLEHDSENDIVAATDHPAYDDPGLRNVLETAADSNEELDALFDALAAERRLVALAVLADRDRSMDLETVAYEIATRETGGQATDDIVDDVLVDLVHVHRPKLEAAGLIASEEDGLSFEGHSDLQDGWLAIGPRSPIDRDLEERGGSVLSQPI